MEQRPVLADQHHGHPGRANAGTQDPLDEEHPLALGQALQCRTVELDTFNGA